jgi:hypothetical protein
MKHLRKFNENLSDIDIFADKQELLDILVEYSDNGFEYKTDGILWRTLSGNPDNYKLDDLYPIHHGVDHERQHRLKSKGIGVDKDGQMVEFNPDEVSVLTRGYLITFDEELFGEVVITDKQRIGDKFSFINKNFYRFVDITKDIQHKFESLGYLFFMSNKFSIIILEDKRK